jgi:hypothetical protein
MWNYTDDSEGPEAEDADSFAERHPFGRPKGLISIYNLLIPSKC